MNKIMAIDKFTEFKLFKKEVGEFRQQRKNVESEEKILKTTISWSQS